jgi:type I restriction enzyme R subunit
MNEDYIEQLALGWLEALGYPVVHGPHMAPGELFEERTGFTEAWLPKRLRDAIERLNPKLGADAIDEAYRAITVPQHASLVTQNRAYHKLMVEGHPVPVRREDGTTGHERACFIDFDDLSNNDWLAVNQYTVVEGKVNRRADVVVFVNGLPLAVLELKNAANAQASVESAFKQLQTYKKQIPALFHHNLLCIASDGLFARVGTITTGKERFAPWRTIEGDKLAPSDTPELEVMVRGVFDQRRFLDLLRHFTVYEDDPGGQVLKKVAGYHQFHAVNVAVEETLRATMATPDAVEPAAGYSALKRADAKPGDRRVGVIWHTQGSGKSLTMLFYAGRLVQHPGMENPTIVMLTDRNDLDEQLFDTFSRGHELLRQRPSRAGSRAEARQLLAVASGGVVFATIQKFLPDEAFADHPVLSDRRNIVVIADEAHRSQYGFIEGFARHLRTALPNASFIGFTGTPVEKDDADTRSVFGDYISIYDIKRAVDDGATVPIYYEEKPKLDPAFEEATEGEELEGRERLKTKWAALEKLVGSEKRLDLIADDLLKHWEARLTVVDGKAMIVCMSRRICVDLYNALIKLRPDWHSANDAEGVLKVVMTGSASDPEEWQDHIRNKARREELAKRFKKPDDPLKLVVVRDMWLTGFDAPCLHTLYVDKPMRSHGLMQAIARVNRVFRDKPNGLVVDYLGLANELRKATATYTESGGAGEATHDKEQALVVMQEKYEVCGAFFHGFDRTPWTNGAAQDKLNLLPKAQEHILAQGGDEPHSSKSRFLTATNELRKAFALASPHERATAIVEEVRFFMSVAAVLRKREVIDREESREDMDQAIRQLVSQAVAPGGVVDIFAAAGLKKPELSILSDAFLDEVKDMPQRNLAVEFLRKMLNGEVRRRERQNIVQARSFAEMLEQTIRGYQNRAIETVEVIQRLIELAKHMREADKRGENLGLTEDEVAFYDALEVNDSAVKVLGEPTLKQIAQDLVKSIRANVTIDWTERDAVKAHLRVAVKRILRRYGYPPDKQARATELVLEQAETIAKEWAEV